MLKRLSIAIVFLSLFTKANSELLPLFSQYMLNGFTLNSAMAGYDGFTTLNLTSRQQWLGLENAPQTFTLTFQTRILKRSYIIRNRGLRGNRITPSRTGRVGLGLSIFNDRNGYLGQTGVSMSYAYHISFTNSQLSFGVAGSMTQMRLNIDPGFFRLPDPRQSLISAPLYIPDANIGMFYTNGSFYGGVSAAELFQSSVKFGTSDIIAYQVSRNYYLITGYKFNPDVFFTYEPTLLFKTTDLLQPQVDLSFKVTYREDVWGGLSYRTGNVFIAFVGFRKNRVYIGYSFDYGLSSLDRSYYGTHELNISLKFGDSARRYKWLNRY
jgi:type IX secretion system PorP/SprF family membrane protein